MAKDAVGAAFREVYKDEPSIVGKTRKKSGAARAQKQKIEPREPISRRRPRAAKPAISLAGPFVGEESAA